MPLNMDKIAALYNGTQLAAPKPVENSGTGDTKEGIPPEAGGRDNVIEIRIKRLRDFPRSRFNRYRLHQGEKMEELVGSIRRNGILQPIVVRPLEGGDYQVVDGRNRREAARIAGYETVPCIVRQLDDDEAIQQLNFLNERFRELAPSEKAFAYELEHRQTSHQGFQSDLALYHCDTKLQNSEEDTRMTKWRYRQLCNLYPDGMLDALDKKLINVSAGVELSSLSRENQLTVYQFFFEETAGASDDTTNVIARENRSITPNIVRHLKSLQEQKETFSQEDIAEMLESDGPKKYSFPMVKVQIKSLRKKYPALATMEQKEIENIMLTALEEYLAKI